MATMILLELLSWWYGRGWSGEAVRTGKQVQAMLDFFSVGLLARTLFDPFRQIDATPRVSGPRQQAFFDQLFSRIMGFIIRSFTIITGFIVAAGVGLFSLLQLIVWPLLPFTPLIGLGLMIRELLG